MSERSHHRPQQRDAAFFEAIVGDDDAATAQEAAERTAGLIVRGAHNSTDAEVTQRVLHLAETEGLTALAQLWSRSAPESLAGSLWRLYLLHSWVRRQPECAAEEFAAGRDSAPVARVISGVEEPPTREHTEQMIDAVLTGVSESEYADVLFRAAAFARVVAAGRAKMPDRTTEQVARILGLSEQLEAAGHIELSRGLG